MFFVKAEDGSLYHEFGRLFAFEPPLDGHRVPLALLLLRRRLRVVATCVHEAAAAEAPEKVMTKVVFQP